MNADSILREFAKRARRFKVEAHQILGVHEAAPSRIIKLDEAYKALGSLSVRQDELLRQALRCVENELYRASHVMGWAGFMDFLEEKIQEKGMSALKAVRPKWNGKSIEDIRESYPEYQIIEAGRDMKLYSKTVSKALIGLLNKRNECAHPSDYFPNLNETLGYISEVITRISSISV